MNDVREYKLDLSQIKKTFKYKEKSLTHSQDNKFKLFPFTANDTKLVSDFSGVIGAFSRFISNKEINGDFKVETFLESVLDKVGEYEGVNSKEIFKDIINSMFIDEGTLVDFDIKALNYIESTSSEEKIARFLYTVFYDDRIKGLVSEHYDRPTNNILYKIVLESLPELKDKKKISEGYKCYLEFIKELFIEDFTFLINNEDLYKKSLKRFLEYYYIFYISQTILKLDRFEKADLSKPDKIYYTLSWESTSKNRTAYKFGWELLKKPLNSIFAHAVTLEFLNHHNLEEQLGYIELNELFNNQDKEKIESQIEEIFNGYIERITDKNWDDFSYKRLENDTNGFDSVYKLFGAIDYQFENSKRSRANEAYKNWFAKFVYDNFGKRRGSLGYNLNITEEDIILMTKICIKNNKKLKLNLLFDEFEKRGLFFDRDSKTKIIQLFEKLNLLEKKSDSGDAQYVRSIL